MGDKIELYRYIDLKLKFLAKFTKIVLLITLSRTQELNKFIITFYDFEAFVFRFYNLFQYKIYFTLLQFLTVCKILKTFLET
jgi:hypothetical protein